MEHKYKAEALGSIQLMFMQVYFEGSCSSEPVCADLGSETLKHRRDFHEINYHESMCMNDKTVLLKLISKDWDKVKTILEDLGSPQVTSLKKELGLQDKVLGIKLFKKALDKRECKEFEMAFWHK